MNENSIVGTCQYMCPLSESSKRVISAFELDPKGNVNPNYAIKEFHRSEAGKVYYANETRPLPVLIKTLDHLINYVIGEKTNKTPETSELEMYRFVRGRIRAINSDITIQNLEGEEVIQIFETSLLFFIWAGTRFNMENDDSFSQKQNIDQITKINVSLAIQYDNYLLKNHKHFPSEPFFRAIDLITFLKNPGYMPKLLSFPEEIINTKYIQIVIEIRKSMLSNDISHFLTILDHTPVQMASYILQNSQFLWKDMGYELRQCLTHRPFPKTFLTDYLKIPHSILNIWSKSYALSESPDHNYFNYNIKSEFQTELIPSVIVPDKFRQIKKFNNPIEFLQIDEDFSSVAFQLPTEFIQQQQQEEDISPKKEIAQPVAPITTTNENENEIKIEQDTDQSLAVPSKKVTIQEEPNVDQDNIPISPPEPDFPKESKDNAEISVFLNENNSHFPKIVPNRPNSTNPKLFKKDGSRISVTNRAISKKNLIISNPELFEEKISIKEIMSMIPYRIPRMSYACILLVADDESSSSTFARNRFFPKNQDGSNSNLTVLCEKFRSSSETCYILITRNIDHVGATSIFYCNEFDDPESNENLNQNVPIIKFEAGIGFSPVLTFNSCLRKTIEMGITEINPFNLSDLVQTIFSGFLKSISYTSWQLASANAIFKILNSGLICISDHLVDNSFIKFILPFEHNEFSFDELNKYASKIKSLKFNLIDNISSRRSISGSNWSTYIKNRIDISFPPFIVPLSVKFDQNTFISDIMSELPFDEPSETIF